ncbi:MAG: hypothetical protein AMS26_21475, partial [Bacteroides sp. SM23_62]
MKHKNQLCRSRRYLSAAVIIFQLIGVTLSQGSDQYRNPVGDTIFLADPYVLLHEESYYLYGTSAGDGFKA